MEARSQLHSPAALLPEKELPGTHSIGGCVGDQNGLDDMERRKSCPYRDSNSEHSAVRPVANRYTHCGSLANVYFLLKCFAILIK
jgi:hypothetical protein